MPEAVVVSFCRWLMRGKKEGEETPGSRQQLLPAHSLLCPVLANPPIHACFSLKKIFLEQSDSCISRWVMLPPPFFCLLSVPDHSDQPPFFAFECLMIKS